jgi:hypothetical protein
VGSTNNTTKQPVRSLSADNRAAALKSEIKEVWNCWTQQVQRRNQEEKKKKKKKGRSNRVRGCWKRVGRSIPSSHERGESARVPMRYCCDEGAPEGEPHDLVTSPTARNTKQKI